MEILFIYIQSLRLWMLIDLYQFKVF